jgi:hypothetical protein
LLFHQDKEFIYGQNFFVAITVDAVDAILAPLVAENQNENKPESLLPPKPVAKIWESLGSEKEMEMEAVVPNRDLVSDLN